MIRNEAWKGKRYSERAIVEVDRRCRSRARPAPTGPGWRGGGRAEPGGRRGRRRRRAAGHPGDVRSLCGRRASSRSKSAIALSAWSVEGEENAQNAQRAARTATTPAAFRHADEGAAGLRCGKRQDVEVEEEEAEHRHEVDEALEDDRGEARRGADRMASRHEIGPDDLAGARHDETRHEAHHRRREEAREGDGGERRQQVAPSPGAEEVYEDRGHDDEGAGRRDRPNAWLRPISSHATPRRKKKRRTAATTPPAASAKRGRTSRGGPEGTQPLALHRLDRETALYYNARANVKPSRSEAPGVAEILNPGPRRLRFSE